MNSMETPFLVSLEREKEDQGCCLAWERKKKSHGHNAFPYTQDPGRVTHQGPVQET